MNSSILNWYIAAYPEEASTCSINPNATFFGLLCALNGAGNVYNYIGSNVSSSVLMRCVSRANMLMEYNAKNRDSVALPAAASAPSGNIPMIEGAVDGVPASSPVQALTVTEKNHEQTKGGYARRIRAESADGTPVATLRGNRGKTTNRAAVINRHGSTNLADLHIPRDIERAMGFGRYVKMSITKDGLLIQKVDDATDGIGGLSFDTRVKRMIESGASADTVITETRVFAQNANH